MLFLVVLCVSWTRPFGDCRELWERVIGCGMAVGGHIFHEGVIVWVCFELEEICLEHWPFQNIFH